MSFLDQRELGNPVPSEVFHLKVGSVGTIREPEVPHRLPPGLRDPARRLSSALPRKRELRSRARGSVDTHRAWLENQCGGEPPQSGVTRRRILNISRSATERVAPSV